MTLNEPTCESRDRAVGYRCGEPAKIRTINGRHVALCDECYTRLLRGRQREFSREWRGDEESPL